MGCTRVWGAKDEGTAPPPKAVTQSDQASVHKATWTGEEFIEGEPMPSPSGERRECLGRVWAPNTRFQAQTFVSIRIRNSIVSCQLCALI